MYRRTYVDATHLISSDTDSNLSVLKVLSEHSSLGVIMGFEPMNSFNFKELEITCLLPYRLAISHFIQFINTEFIKYKILIYFS